MKNEKIEWLRIDNSGLIEVDHAIKTFKAKKNAKLQNNGFQPLAWIVEGDIIIRDDATQEIKNLLK